MLATAPLADGRPDTRVVLTRAVLRAADLLGLSAQDLAGVLGLSEATGSRMKTGRYLIDETPKTFEISALFVRLFRALDAITGDAGTARAEPGAWRAPA